MFDGNQIAGEIERMGTTHVVWLPDSTLGPWEQALATHSRLKLIRVCREGEAWAIAAGLHLGGARPLVVIQCTGLFESGDSLRNALFDYGLPLFAIIGYRSFLNPSATDSARTFTEPNLKSWGIDYRIIDAPEKLGLLAPYRDECRLAGRPGVVLIGEGKL